MNAERDRLRSELVSHVDDIIDTLGEANHAREVALPACRRVIRLSGSAIRAVHGLEQERYEGLIAEAEAALRDAQTALAPHPDLVYAGFLHDAEKEYVEARLTMALVNGDAIVGPVVLGVDSRSWMKGLAEAASELRRHLLDRLRDGDLDRGEELLATMDEVYGVLVTVDFPDAISSGLRRTLDALRAVLERTRGDVTTTVLQSRLQQAIEQSAPNRA